MLDDVVLYYEDFLAQLSQGLPIEWSVHSRFQDDDTCTIFIKIDDRYEVFTANLGNAPAWKDAIFRWILGE